MDLMFWGVVVVAIAVLILKERIGARRRFEAFIERTKRQIAIDTVKSLPPLTRPKHR